MNKNRWIVLLLAAMMLLSCGCGVRFAVKPLQTETPTPQVTLVPTPDPKPTPIPTPVPTPAPSAAPEASGDYRRGLVSYDDFLYERPDCDGIADHVAAIRAMVTDGTDSETILSEYEALNDEYDVMLSAYNLASIFSSLDVNNSYYADEMEYLIARNSELNALSTQMEIEIGDSVHRDVVFYDWTEDDYVMLRIFERLYDEEYVQLSTRLQEIINEYWDVMTNTTITYEGVEYTGAKLEDLDVDEETYNQLLNTYYQSLNAQAGELYLELVGIKKQIAAKAGFDNYVEFSYIFEYERDYTVEDAQALWSNAKEYVPTQMRDLINSFTYEEYNGLMMSMNASNQLHRQKDNIEAYVTEVSPEMLEAYQYLIDYRLSLLTASETSETGAYTTYLLAYDVPFIYLHESGGYQDVLTLIHEFGHFYRYYMCGKDGRFTSLDVSEICSQANELLYLPHMAKYMNADTYQGIVKYQIYLALSTIAEGCMFDEFQQYVFNHDLQTVDELNAAFSEIRKSYGTGEDYYVVDSDYVWVNVMHNFESPMYYISYATSIIPALEIMEISLTDREEALRIYNNIIRSDPEMKFAKVLEENGLRSAFSKETIISVVNAAVDLTGVGTRVS